MPIQIVSPHGRSLSPNIRALVGLAVARSTSETEWHAGMPTLTAGVARVSGVVQRDTLISNSVVRASYATGAANI